MMNLSGKTALVTGAGRGIGRGCALALARAGADLVVNDREENSDLKTTASQIRALRRQCTLAAGDVFARTGCEAVVDKALEAAGRIDIFVSNPAYSFRSAFADFDPDEFEKVIAGTLSSGFHMSQLVARHMIKRGGLGKIVFISSVQAEMPIVQSVAYNGAKAGLNHMAATIAVELSTHRINVNVIEPGWIDTPAEHRYFGEEQLAEAATKLPWGRLGTPEDVGKAAAFLSSEDADYITGAVLRVDGGFCFKDCRDFGNG